MLTGLVMIAVVGILHQVLANPMDQHLTETSIQIDGLRAFVSRLEASLASKDIALQALTSSQSKLAREFETCSSEQVKLLVGRQALDLEFAKLEEKSRQLEADKLDTDTHRLRLKTENDKLMVKIGELEHANERLLADKVSLEESLSSLHDEYLATLQDSEAVHKKLLKTIKRSKAVKKQMTKKIMAMKKQTQDLLNERKETARRLIQAIKDIYSDVLANSEALVVSQVEEPPQDPLALPESTEVTEDTHQAGDITETCEKDKNNIHQEEPYKAIKENSFHSVMDREGIVNGNEIDRNEGTNDKGEEIEMERDHNSTVMDLLQPHVDESGTANTEGLQYTVDNDTVEEKEVNLNDNAAEWKESENDKKLENNADNADETVDGNETNENNIREESAAPQDKGNTVVDEQSVGNNEGLEYTVENSNNQGEMNDNEIERIEDENNEKEKIQVEKDDYNTLVELMRSLVDEASRDNKDLENITDIDEKEVMKDNEKEEIKYNETEPKGEDGIYERTELQASTDYDNEFTYLMDSLRSFIDDLDEENNDDGNRDEVNDEDDLNDETVKDNEGSNKRLRDEM